MGIILSYRKFLSSYKTRGHRLNHLSNYRYLFPIKASPELAGIVADLMGDGNLQGFPKWRLDYTSKDIKELSRFNKKISKLFGVSGKIRGCLSNKYGKTYNLGINNAPLARIMYSIGVPPGEKVLAKFKIPWWIITNKKCTREFMKRLYSCEGSIMDEPNRRFPQIRLNMWKSEKLLKEALFFMSSIKRALKNYFKINSTIKVDNKFNIRKDGVKTISLRIYILGESVRLFHERIGFEGAKQVKLTRILKEKKRRFKI